MPGFDGTGPRGLGSGTGWGRGPCGAGWRRGFGRRAGACRWGYGFQRAVNAPWDRRTGYASQLDETESRREEKAYLESELEAIQQRLAELDKQT